MSINKDQLHDITVWLQYNIFRNPDVMFPQYDETQDESIIEVDGEQILLTDIIATLHNLLYESVTGERYNYMWHWANKIGSWCEDDIFNDLLTEEKK